MELTADMQEEGCVYCEQFSGGEIHKHTSMYTQTHKRRTTSGYHHNLRFLSHLAAMHYTSRLSFTTSYLCVCVCLCF